MYFGQFIGILVILEACILINKKKKKKSLGGILVVLEVQYYFDDFRGILVIFYISGLFWGF
jgi:hypothetical protein